MFYTITPHTKRQAKRIGVVVKPSHKPEKKIDVFRDGHLIGSIGAKGMGDYGVYLEEKGKEYAEERRRLYKKRHQKDRTKTWSKGWLSDRLLW